MIARIDYVICFRVDNSHENAAAIAIWAILAHTTCPDAAQLPVATSSVIAYCVTLIRSRRATIVAHVPSTVPPPGIWAVVRLAAGVATTSVYDDGHMTHLSGIKYQSSK